MFLQDIDSKVNFTSMESTQQRAENKPFPIVQCLVEKREVELRVARLTHQAAWSDVSIHKPEAP
jgi:hypothetical protein